ncbi:hypothetical protein DPX16_5787 [Anabarilius grahami]|uniref:Retrotransposon gag domain-containing protein n=1 Tax=Anabarilius grahami TaxID=495550 RepID=A0A3N0YWB9_ANAGA|nr:hypothetical protein DPX16_5787 [Anabarilius grahami]
MGLFLVPVPPQSCQCKLSADDRLWSIQQDGRPLERYVEEFAELSSKVIESINLVLFLNGSEFEIKEVHRRSYFPLPAPSDAKEAWPAHQPPISSTYRSSGHAPGLQPDTTPKPSKRRATKRSRRSKKPAILEPAPVFHEPASAFHEPAPVPVGLLIEYEGMSWIPSPDPSPVSTEPAPAAPEPAPEKGEVLSQFSRLLNSISHDPPVSTPALTSLISPSALITCTWTSSSALPL